MTKEKNIDDNDKFKIVFLEEATPLIAVWYYAVFYFENRGLWRSMIPKTNISLKKINYKKIFNDDSLSIEWDMACIKLKDLRKYKKKRRRRSSKKGKNYGSKSSD